MALEKLMIQNTDTKDEIKALFNPNQYQIVKETNWCDIDQNGKDIPDAQFTSGQRRELDVELFFDTYSLEKKVNVKTYVDELEKLMLIDVEKHRPPILLVSWGKKALNFRCILTSLTQKYTMFLNTGMPVRATLNAKFKEVDIVKDSKASQGEKQSPDHTKMRVFKEGDSLQMIANREYEDPRMWKVLADHNDIENPLDIKAGTVIEVPPIEE